MRAVIQRVNQASVEIEGKITGKINKGLLILIGIENLDNQEDADYLVQKISGLRIFSDDEGKMNLNIGEINGQYLVISQFTLHASTKKGNRPSFIKAARPEIAIPLYQYFSDSLEKCSSFPIETGVFGANMQVQLINDGPVTVIIDSKIKE